MTTPTPPPTPNSTPGSDPHPAGLGRPGDFDFLAGEWTIAHRKRRPDLETGWDEFTGAATCWSILEGLGSIEELRIPARDFAGVGVRLLHRDTGVWHDFWVNARSGELSTPGQTGSFADGVGTFTATDDEAERPYVVRGVWDRITPTSCRWHQRLSFDGGQTWEDDWFMDWTRVGPDPRSAG